MYDSNLQIGMDTCSIASSVRTIYVLFACYMYIFYRYVDLPLDSINGMLLYGPIVDLATSRSTGAET
jgi:hypothetical protein